MSAPQFEAFASEIAALTLDNVRTTLAGIEAFGNSITASAEDLGETWPNVTVNHFSSKAERLATVAINARVVTFSVFVPHGQRLPYEEYGRSRIHEQVQADIDYQYPDLNLSTYEMDTISDQITYFDPKRGGNFPEESDGPYQVNWQTYPLDFGFIKVFNNQNRVQDIRSASYIVNETGKASLSFFWGREGPVAQVIQPIFEKVLPAHRADERKQVGVMHIVLHWVNFFQKLLPQSRGAIFVVVKSSCGFATTYLIEGLSSAALGLGALHDPEFDDMELVTPFFTPDYDKLQNLPEDICADTLSLHMYPSKELRDSYMTHDATLFTAMTTFIFVFTSLAFLIFEWTVRAHERRVMNHIHTQEVIVSDLFPANVRDRLYGIGDEDDPNHTPKDGKPIADLHLASSVLFADIAGFTAWASAREPTQVLTLLETIYHAFDKIARRRNVFKVETIGDCYVAATGLPEKQPDHALCIAKFARDIMASMEHLVRKLELTLGPGTSRLRLRIGIHSGQVTAGVLRGERSRFQLFGDTVNFASRMESTGLAECIQVSQSMADEIEKSGYGCWLRLRDDSVNVAGKGTMRTYWLATRRESRKQDHLGAETAPDHSSKEEDFYDHTEKDPRGSESDDVLSEIERGSEADVLSEMDRLIEWNVEVLSGLLKQVVASHPQKGHESQKVETTELEHEGKTVLEQCKEIVSLPQVTMQDFESRLNPDSVELDEKVVRQLRSLVSRFAGMYEDNPFHNFEHASHVAASVCKSLHRIVSVEETDTTTIEDLAGHSYGITSDPLTQFAVVFSAVIHDLQHPGVPNATLVKEGVPIAKKYKEKSVAEQNSVDLAWGLLMQPEYVDLRACIYTTKEELRRFRQLVVNVVMATDICDKELNTLRKQRWELAFAGNESKEDDSMNRKATIVIEHLIQASDVAHTMQHWCFYRKWNERLFDEMFLSYKLGRSDTNPAESWYEGELGFFDYYIIPLTKKLASCGVFGVSSQEYLNYAQSNRDEWARKGEAVLKEYMKKYEQH